MAVVDTPLTRAAAAMTDRGVQALLIGPGPDLVYLTGYHALPLERLTLLVARADGAHRLIVPRLEEPRAAAEVDDVPIVTWDETDDPYRTAAAALDGLPANPLLGVGDHLWATFLLGLQRARPDAEWVRASTVLRELRMRKTAEELEGLRRAGAAIDAVHARVPELLAPGRTEAEVAADIGAAMLAAGHDAVDFVIVGSGPNGASPHHECSDRRLERGDAVVVDIGGPVGGWFSDCTRTYVLGTPPDGFTEAYDALLAAQEAAVAAVRPGVTAHAVDAAARDALTAAGYGEQFIHRTGHGIGLEVHEEPYIVAGNDLVLEPGMTFSVEPGVYFPGRFGIRIEDIVAVTADGVERLNHAPRTAVVVP